MMWLGLSSVGIPIAASLRRTVATRSRWRSRSTPLTFRWRMLAAAPAASAGESAVVKMNPLAKLRTKSHIAAEPAI